MRAQEQLLEMAQEMYRTSGGRVARPMYPFVLVWVLPKAQKIGQIITPENQNKVMFEGVVLEIWNPFLKILKVEHTEQSSLDPAIEDSEHTEVVKVQMESQFKPGDQIMFPHWAGVPTDLGRAEGKEFRFVKEHTTYNPPDNAVGVFEFEENSVQDNLYEIISTSEISPQGCRQAVEELLEKYHIVPRLGQTARTISGK